MRLQEVLSSKSHQLVNISRTASLKDAIRLISTERVGMLLVVEAGGQLAGMLSERDIICFIAKHGLGAINYDVGSAMVGISISASPSDSVTHIMQIMTEQRARHLPVFADATLVGVISIGDILKSRITEKDQETAVLRDFARASIANEV